jgi:hypothetical protein
MQIGAVETGTIWYYLLTCIVLWKLLIRKFENSERDKGSLKNLKVQVSDTTMLNNVLQLSPLSS